MSFNQFCPYCQEESIVRFGFQEGRQRYKCENCGKEFVEGTNQSAYSAEVMSAAVELHKNGLSYGVIAELLRVKSTKMVSNWCQAGKTTVEYNNELLNVLKLCKHRAMISKEIEGEGYYIKVCEFELDKLVFEKLKNGSADEERIAYLRQEIDGHHYRVTLLGQVDPLPEKYARKAEAIISAIDKIIVDGYTNGEAVLASRLAGIVRYSKGEAFRKSVEEDWRVLAVLIVYSIIIEQNGRTDLPFCILSLQ